MSIRLALSNATLALMSYRHFAFLLLSAAALHAQKPMSNDDVLRLVEQHLSTAQIVERINSAPSGYRLDFEDVAKLKKAGASEVVIQAMFARQTGGKLQLEGISEDSPVTAATSIASSPVTTAALPTRRTRSENEWALEAGRPEIAWHGGGGTFWNRGGGVSYEWNTGAGLAVGINHYLAGFGDYNYNETTGFTRSLAFGGYRIHDLIGGLRISSPGRIQFYGVAGGGVAHITETFYRLGSITKPTLALGGGVNVSFNRRFGVQSDFRVLRPVDFIWYSRASGGFYFRF